MEQSCDKHIQYYRYCVACNRKNGIKFVFSLEYDSNFEWIEVTEVPE